MCCVKSELRVLQRAKVTLQLKLLVRWHLVLNRVTHFDSIFLPYVQWWCFFLLCNMLIINFRACQCNTLFHLTEVNAVQSEHKSNFYENENRSHSDWWARGRQLSKTVSQTGELGQMLEMIWIWKTGSCRQWSEHRETNIREVSQKKSKSTQGSIIQRSDKH